MQSKAPGVVLRTVCLGQAPVAPILQAALWRCGRGAWALRAPPGLHRRVGVVSFYTHKQFCERSAVPLLCLGSQGAVWKPTAHHTTCESNADRPFIAKPPSLAGKGCRKPSQLRHFKRPTRILISLERQSISAELRRVCCANWALANSHGGSGQRRHACVAGVPFQ